MFELLDSPVGTLGSWWRNDIACCSIALSGLCPDKYPFLYPCWRALGIDIPEDLMMRVMDNGHKQKNVARYMNKGKATCEFVTQDMLTRVCTSDDAAWGAY